VDTVRGATTPRTRARAKRNWTDLFRPAALLASGGIAFYVLLPSLLSVFGSWRSLSHLEWDFAGLTLVCELLSFA
jgi:hypothetical protein